MDVRGASQLDNHEQTDAFSLQCSMIRDLSPSLMALRNMSVSMQSLPGAEGGGDIMPALARPLGAQ